MNCSLDHDVILTSAAERKELDNRISNQLASSRLLRNIAVGERKKGLDGTGTGPAVKMKNQTFDFEVEKLLAE